MLQKARFFSGIVMLYLLTIGTIGGILYSSHLFGTPVWARQDTNNSITQPIKLPPKTIAGKPLRIVIENAGIDLPLDSGIYNEQDGSWTLSATHAQYAIMSAPANNHAGTTFVYGHGTDAVFGKIGITHPPTGTVAKLYTDSYVFSYILQDIHDDNPDDTSIFNDMTHGTPRLVVQTCTGAFSEWRTMFTFTFQKVSQQ